MELKRDLDPVLLAELSKPVFFPIALVRVNWPSGLAEFHTGAGALPHDGTTFVGTLVDGASLGAIEIPEEAGGIVPQEAVLTLYAPFDDLIAQMDADATGRQIDIWFGATTEPGGNQLVGEPYRIFTGSISGDNLAVESGGLAGLQIRAKAGTHGRVKATITHSDEDHQATVPGDTIFERSARATAYRLAPPRW